MRHGFPWVFLLLLCVLNATAQEEQVLFSAPGGVYEDSFTLELGCLSPQHHIRYTTNGNQPSAASALYTDPLMLNEQLYSHSDIYTIQISPDDLVFVPDSVRHAIVVRAAVFDENDSCVSETATNTYLIKNLGFVDDGYAVMSICADSLALFDYETGIFVPGVFFNPDDPKHTGNYYQKGRDWERLCNVEFYEPDDNSGINQTCGVRTHGNLSRRHPAKGMKIYAREEYGKKRFNHCFFQDSSINSFKHLVIKPFAVFEPYSGVQDYFCTTLARQLNVESPLCRPVLLYLNGEYWGIYFIQEKTDERFLEDHHGIDPDHCNIIGNWKGQIENGTNTSFKQMMKWFANADLSNNEVYQEACNYIDIDNFIDYIAVESFVGNWDWPGNNMRCWQEGNGRWRWIFFDGDATLMGTTNVLVEAAVYAPPQTWINYPEAKLILGKLLKNSQFQDSFIHRVHELCESLFLYENTFPIFYDIKEFLRPKINDQRLRFGYPPTDDLWIHGNDVINTFLRHRIEQYYTMLEELLTIGVNEVTQAPISFNCSPNPTKGTLHLMIQSETKVSSRLEIIDVTGRTVYQCDIDLKEGYNDIPIESGLPAGLYLVRVGNHSTRLIIE